MSDEHSEVRVPLRSSATEMQIGELVFFAKRDMPRHDHDHTPEISFVFGQIASNSQLVEAQLVMHPFCPPGVVCDHQFEDPDADKLQSHLEWLQERIVGLTKALSEFAESKSTTVANAEAWAKELAVVYGMIEQTR